FWSRRLVAQRAVRAERVVVVSPATDQDFSFAHGVEDLPVEHLVAQLAIEALVVAVLPWRAGLDVERLHADPAKPFPHNIGGKLRAIVRSDMRRRAVPSEQIGEHR